MNSKDLIVLSHFRNNARISLTKMSRQTKIPVSTIFDKLKVYEKEGLIKKYCTLVNFKELGFEIKTSMFLRVNRDNKLSFQRFLIKHPRINNLFRVNNGFDYLIEAIFKDLDEFDEFNKELELFNVLDKKEFFLMEDLKREDFLSHKENKDLLK